MPDDEYAYKKGKDLGIGRGYNDGFDGEIENEEVPEWAFEEGDTDSFKEIMQVGLECIGDIDEYSICEVLLLAAKSLKKISKKSVLDISNISLIAEILDKVDSNIRANGSLNIDYIPSGCQEPSSTH